ncbi:MAG: hypothetical protein JWM09_1271, partial [Francisellaceae bacterium]|nr:hypothetical protein [Francisellaceae bacterium]
FPQQIQNVRKNLPTIIDEQNNNLSDLAKNLFSKLYEDFVSLDKRIEDTDKQINALFKTNYLKLNDC